MDIGIYLPTFVNPTVAASDRTLAANAARAERLGFSALWVIDHPLPTERVHDSSWYQPLTALTSAAAATERIGLGTASLSPFGHPFALAKQLASLAALAGPRVTLGASSGWFEGEYELFGYALKQRAGRTDECLSALRRLLSEPRVTYEGRYWQIPDAALAPRPEWHLPIMIGGGSRLSKAGADADVPVMADSVLSRIVEHDGWLAPCSGSDSVTFEDLAKVRAAVDARPAGSDGFRYVQVQWTYVVDTNDREKALRLQMERFQRVAGEGRAAEHLQECYLLGSIDEIGARVARTRHAGSTASQ